MPRIIRIIIKLVAFAVILPIGLFLGGTLAFVYYTSHSVQSFCDGVIESDTAQTLIDRALAKNLFYARWQGKDAIWILNRPLEDPPMFRIACAVTFKDGKVSGKNVIDAD